MASPGAPPPCSWPGEPPAAVLAVWAWATAPPPAGAVEVCNGVALVDPEKCVACGKCVGACPKGLIHLAPVKPRAVVRCSSCDKGKATMQSCKVGCIGCMKCQKTCEFEAVTVKNGLAQVDPGKCTGCGKCAEACPRHIITME